MINFSIAHIVRPTLGYVPVEAIEQVLKKRIDIVNKKQIDQQQAFGGQLARHVLKNGHLDDGSLVALNHIDPTSLNTKKSTSQNRSTLPLVICQRCSTLK